jgi:uncharacterized protein (TIGR00730 family)
VKGAFTVCVFSGARPGTDARYREAARHFGQRLGERGLALVYGGAQVGLMGVLADAALAAGARVTGVLPKALSSAEVAHTGLAELLLTEGLHARKAEMTARAHAFVALPGGFGTLDELFEALTWQQLGLHTRPVGLLDVEGYFQSLLAFLDGAVDKGLLAPRDRARLMAAPDADVLLDALGAPRAEP